MKVVKQFLSAAQNIADKIADEEKGWEIREKILGLSPDEELLKILYISSLPKQVDLDNAIFMLNLFAQQKYSDTTYPYVITTSRNDVDLIYPLHYKAYIDKVYLHQDLQTLSVIFLRNPMKLTDDETKSMKNDVQLIRSYLLQAI